MRNEERRSVRDLPLFATMDMDAFERLTPASFLQRFPVGVTLINEGEPADFLHVVLEGAVELFVPRQTTGRRPLRSCGRLRPSSWPPPSATHHNSCRGERFRPRAFS